MVVIFQLCRCVRPRRPLSVVARKTVPVQTGPSRPSIQIFLVLDDDGWLPLPKCGGFLVVQVRLRGHGRWHFRIWHRRHDGLYVRHAATRFHRNTFMGELLLIMATHIRVGNWLFMLTADYCSRCVCFMLDRSLFPLFFDVQHLLCQLFRPAQHVLDYPDCNATTAVLVGYVAGVRSGLTTKVCLQYKLILHVWNSKIH